MEALKILASGEDKVLPGAGEGPKGSVNAPRLREVVDFCHFSPVQIQFALVKGHIGHCYILLKNIFCIFIVNLGIIPKSRDMLILAFNIYYNDSEYLWQLGEIT
jgi:hypothetical protein